MFHVEDAFLMNKQFDSTDLCLLYRLKSETNKWIPGIEPCLCRWRELKWKELMVQTSSSALKSSDLDSVIIKSMIHTAILQINTVTVGSLSWCAGPGKFTQLFPTCPHASCWQLSSAHSLLCLCLHLMYQSWRPPPFMPAGRLTSVTVCLSVSIYGKPSDADTYSIHTHIW